MDKLAFCNQTQFRKKLRFALLRAPPPFVRCPGESLRQCSTHNTCYSFVHCQVPLNDTHSRCYTAAQRSLLCSHLPESFDSNVLCESEDKDTNVIDLFLRSCSERNTRQRFHTAWMMTRHRWVDVRHLPPIKERPRFARFVKFARFSRRKTGETHRPRKAVRKGRGPARTSLLRSLASTDEFVASGWVLRFRTLKTNPRALI